MYNRFIVCDVSFLCWRNFHTSMKDLTHHDIPTGTIFGMLRDIVTLQNDLATMNIAFCFDSRNSKREKIHPGYKASRKLKMETEDEAERRRRQAMYTQINQLRTEVLPDLGFRNLFHAEGYEADDLIASFCRNHQQTEIFIVSADHDLFQLLTDHVSIYTPKDRKTYGSKEYYREWGILPLQWPYVKAIAGCNSDDVPGVPGVGEKTAAKFIRKQMNKKTKTYEAIIASKEQVRRNLKLVKLPFKNTPTVTATTDEVNEKKWRKITQDLGMQSLVRSAPKFKD